MSLPPVSSRPASLARRAHPASARTTSERLCDFLSRNWKMFREKKSKKSPDYPKSHGWVNFGSRLSKFPLKFANETGKIKFYSKVLNSWITLSEFSLANSLTQIFYMHYQNSISLNFFKLPNIMSESLHSEWWLPGFLVKSEVVRGGGFRPGSFSIFHSLLYVS